MRVRRAKKDRTRITAAVVTAGLVLAVAGCSSGDDGDDTKSAASSSDASADGGGADKGSSGERQGEPLAQVKGGGGISLEISDAERDEGGFVTVTGKIRNDGGKFWSGVAWKSDESEVGSANPSSMAAAKLVDKKGKKRYYVLRDTEGRCLCTSFKGGMQSGDSKTWYAQFPAPPEGNDTLDFQIADMPTASITVSGE
ncbi:hypothetical protein [Streptomyces cacaoi]|uniref:hypothetical protein n=1 Tax=Streptomyces cacaoi TaxID=1898 RepID=UPI0011F3EDE1|nr:hypothetical protein [Streptomyces cacaoi]